MTAPLTAAPVLTTERLVLRGPERDDLGPFARWVTTSARMEAVGGKGWVDDAWRGFLIGVGHWAWHGYGFFTLVPRDSGQPAGRVGLLNHDGYEAPEIAWHLFDGFEGRGYATEAALAVRAWARQERGIGRLVSYIDPSNAPSQGVARRLGAATDGSRAAHDPDAEVWEHEAPA